MKHIFTRPETDDENWLPIADIMTSLFIIFLFIAIYAIQNVSKVHTILELSDTETKVLLNLISSRERELEEAKAEIRVLLSDLQSLSLETMKANASVAMREVEIDTLKEEVGVYKNLNTQNQLIITRIGLEAASLEKLRRQIYADLQKEFRFDLPVWQANLDGRNLVIRFNEPDVLFLASSAEVRPRFQSILMDFFPRYLNVLERYFNKIDEVRIEGHTSSEWNRDTSKKEAFLLNMQLSQARTQSILDFCFRLFLPKSHQDWIQRKATAKGFSSIRLILDENEVEDKAASRRVEFRIFLGENRVINAIKRLADDQV